MQVSSGEDEGPIETALERAQRDQVRVGLRLESLRQKMERLAQRYQDEGRARNAELLRGAMTRFDEDRLLDVSRELQRNLEQSNLSSVEQQDELVASLEEIQALLRDRRDMDELSRQSDLARQGLSELSFLAENERRLLSQTRAARRRPPSAPTPLWARRRWPIRSLDGSAIWRPSRSRRRPPSPRSPGPSGHTRETRSAGPRAP